MLGFGRPQVERAVRPLPVVVVDVDTQHAFEVAAVEDQQSVEALGARGSDEALGDRVRFGRADRRSDDLDAFAAEDVLDKVQASWRACWVVQALSGLGARRSTSSRISSPIGGRPTRHGYVEPLATSRRCQRSSVVGVTTNERQRARGNRRLAAERKTRSEGLSSGRASWRRSTASSWRSTTISSSLNSSERKRNAPTCSRRWTMR